MSITWNGVSSDTIGVIVERIPNRHVPTRRFSPQQVAGRNGNILLVDKSFPNVEQEYEVYLSAEAQGLPSVARACAEWLMGPDGYCRLEDSYDTTVYREAFLMGGYDLENILNKFGRCTITFSCKPQKYLLTGDTPIEIPAGITTYTGDVVQFDGVTGASITSLSTTITPIQDLHGYDNPWPAGGGKNLLNPTTMAPGYLESNGNVHAQGDQKEYYSTEYYEVGSQAVISVGYNAFTASEAKWIAINWYDANKTNLSRANKNESISTFTPRSDAVYFRVSMRTYDHGVENCYCALGDDITFSPYSNICPITGRTGLSVYRTGKNLLNASDFLNKASKRRCTATATNDIITVTCTEAGQVWVGSGNAVVGNSLANDYVLYVNGGETITASTKNGSSVSGYLFIEANENKVVTKITNVSATATLRSDTRYVTFRVTIANSMTLGAVWADAIQIESGSATAYEPYNGNTYAVDWTTEAGTVYGGTLDVVSGVLTVDSVYFTDKWKNGAGATSLGSYTKRSFTHAVKSKYPNYAKTPICNVANYKAQFAEDSLHFYVNGSTSNNILVFLPNDTDGETDIQVCYELATPLTYQLTPQEIGVLVGTNYVWLSDGDVSLTVTTPLGGIVTNPTPFEARPLLTVSGVGEITVNGKSIQILESVSDFEIDCETMEAEDNSKIYCMDFPELSGGENEIVGDGSITALTVTPRWWTL